MPDFVPFIYVNGVAIPFQSSTPLPGDNFQLIYTGGSALDLVNPTWQMGMKLVWRLLSDPAQYMIEYIGNEHQPDQLHGIYGSAYDPAEGFIFDSSYWQLDDGGDTPTDLSYVVSLIPPADDPDLTSSRGFDAKFGFLGKFGFMKRYGFQKRFGF